MMADFTAPALHAGSVHNGSFPVKAAVVLALAALAFAGTASVSLPLGASLVALLCVGVLALSPRPLWQDELGGLTPVPRALIERDSTLRRVLSIQMPTSAGTGEPASRRARAAPTAARPRASPVRRC